MKPSDIEKYIQRVKESESDPRCICNSEKKRLGEYALEVCPDNLDYFTERGEEWMQGTWCDVHGIVDWNMMKIWEQAKKEKIKEDC